MSESKNVVPYKGFATTAIHAFHAPENCLAVVAPIVASATYQQYGPNDYKKYIYGRDANPNREVLENTLAALERGKYGLCFSSGMGTFTAITNMFESGDHIICGEHIYQGINCVLTKNCRKFGVEVSFADQDKIAEAIKENTKMIWLETLTNPTMRVADIKAVADLAHKHNIIFGMDNTFVTPYFLRPLDFGADIVMHSISKYLNGHTDVIMGVAITNNENIYKQLKFLQISLGIVPSPFDCYQVTRSIKTLALRMEQHMTNSLAVARFLEKHPKVEKVLHPGLHSHPQYELFKKQASGYSGMLSFYLRGGLKETRKFLKEIKLISIATSLGGVESLAGAPYLMTHGALPHAEKLRLNITENLVRLSIGLEDAEDILHDLDQALSKV